MKVFIEWTLEEQLALARMAPTHSENYLSVWTEEGMYEVRNKIHKQCILHEKEAVVGEIDGRKYWVEETSISPKEMWQIPVPNYTTCKKVDTYNLSNGMCCVVEFDPNATYFFTGATVEKAAEWLKELTTTN